MVKKFSSLPTTGLLFFVIFLFVWKGVDQRKVSLQRADFLRENIPPLVSFIRSGEIAREKSLLKSAQQYYRHFLFLIGPRADIYSALGFVSFYLNETNEAIVLFQAALKQSEEKTMPGIYYNLGAAYLQKGRYEEARKAFEKELNWFVENPGDIFIAPAECRGYPGKGECLYALALSGLQKAQSNIADQKSNLFFYLPRVVVRKGTQVVTSY